ncbi:MAG: tRNA glutamyl-Q(34) synthetase GluQRS [Burkholderiaceae bacterium]
MTNAGYVGRFAPSPTGALHAGSMAAALASYLDARAHNGHWFIRIENIDPPREERGVASHIIEQLTAYGLTPDAPVSWQSQRTAGYSAALENLKSAGLAYRCHCSRKAIQLRHQTKGATPPAPGQDLIYDGFCRQRAIDEDQPHAWRFNTHSSAIEWHERADGQIYQELVEQVCGDFVLRRRDLLWSYQLAVVVDDAAQGVTHVVRGDDLASNTARQCLLQAALSLPRPEYLHIPVVRNANGEKLSKQTRAPAVELPGDDADRITVLNRAMTHLGLAPVMHASLSAFWESAVGQWAKRYRLA